MREIKFRAWDHDEERMYQVSNMEFYKGDVFAECESRGSKTFVEIMQYTGLKDVNGKDIYEGDVVSRISEYAIIEVAFGIFECDAFVYSGCNLQDFNASPSGKEPRFPSEDWEVIGNIYENPELVTKSKQ